MNRSGYVDYDDEEDPLAMGRYRNAVKEAIQGKRGQAFLNELAIEMDAMEEKILIAGELIDEYGDCCAIGVVCKSRGIDVSETDPQEPDEVAELVGIASSMAAEIEFWNDDDFAFDSQETPSQRWKRVRKWVDDQIIKTSEVESRS